MTQFALPITFKAIYIADGPVGQVLAGPLFLKGKHKVPFYREQVINKVLGDF